MSNLKNNRWLSILTIILLIANIGTLAFFWSQKRNGGDDQRRRQHPGQLFQFLTKELSLNKEQQEAYSKLRDDHQAAQRQFRDSIRKAKDAMFDLLQQPAASDSLLQEYSRKASSFDQQMDIITFKHFQQVRALCNPEQQKKFDALIKEVMHRMAGPGNRPGPPPGERPENFPGLPEAGHELH